MAAIPNSDNSHSGSFQKIVDAFSVVVRVAPKPGALVELAVLVVGLGGLAERIHDLAEERFSASSPPSVCDLERDRIRGGDGG